MTSLFEASARLRRSWPSAYSFSCASVTFASCYVYLPRAPGVVGEASRLLCSRVKHVDPVWIPRYAGHVHHASCRDAQLAALFAGGALLVPVPRSTVGLAAPWPAACLAAALRQVSLGDRLWAGLRRKTSVRRSANSAAGQRPSVREHYESFAIAHPLMPAEKVVLIDDVISKGRTLLAAAARLQDELPHADIRAFALIRTLGFVSQADRLLQVCHGVIRWAGADARRDP